MLVTEKMDFVNIHSHQACVTCYVYSTIMICPLLQISAVLTVRACSSRPQINKDKQISQQGREIIHVLKIRNLSGFDTISVEIDLATLRAVTHGKHIVSIYLFTLFQLQQTKQTADDYNQSLCSFHPDLQ